MTTEDSTNDTKSSSNKIIDFLFENSIFLIVGALAALVFANLAPEA